MNDITVIKKIIGNNIYKLRTASGMTQAELAEKLNYSDKTVSKWERGEAVPDISVLMDITDFFNVPLEYITVEHDKIEVKSIGTVKKMHIHARAVITCMSLMLVWLVFTLIFVVVRIAYPQAHNEWLAFIYAIPVTMIVWLVLTSIWFNRRRNYLIITCLMWTALLALVISFLSIDINIAIILTLGIPGQIIIFLWSGLGQIIKKMSRTE